MEQIVNPAKAMIKEASTNAETAVAAANEAIAAATSWKAEAERVQDKLHELKSNGVEVDVGYIIDGVIETLRRDPRMPKLSLVDWENLLGDHYGTETFDIKEHFDDDDEGDGEASIDDVICHMSGP